ncbi:hypothetical protein ACWGTO_07605 [Mesorhizobium sp. PL10]
MSTIGDAFGPDGRERGNPFKRGEDGKIPNLTRVYELCRENPRRAIELCKAAGEDLNKWFPNNPQ